MPLIPYFRKTIRKQKSSATESQRTSWNNDNEMEVNYRLGLIIMQILNRHILNY